MDRRPGAAIRGGLVRLLSAADDKRDDDDLRLRKRIGVATGIVSVFAPLSLPILSRGHPVAIVVGLSFTLFSIANLIVLARTRRFERFIVAMATAASIFVAITTWVGGGLTFAGSGLTWGFLIPAAALLALGPVKGARWYWAFVGVVAAALLSSSRFPSHSGSIPTRSSWSPRSSTSLRR